MEGISKKLCTKSDTMFKLDVAITTEVGMPREKKIMQFKLRNEIMTHNLEKTGAKLM
jgi:hypothetical protein